MNLFVTGTGRCGTVTFSKACRHITNFTSGHETMAGNATRARFEYPDRHIEVDPHLAWTLGPIIQRYPDAFYVHLQREREQVVESWLRRGIYLYRGPAPLINVIYQTVSRRLSKAEYSDALGLLYDTINANIRHAFQQVRSQHVWLHNAKQTFPQIWKAIGAEGDLHAASAEFDRRYNRGSQ